MNLHTNQKSSPRSKIAHDAWFSQWYSSEQTQRAGNNTNFNMKIVVVVCSFYCRRQKKNLWQLSFEKSRFSCRHIYTCPYPWIVCYTQLDIYAIPRHMKACICAFVHFVPKSLNEQCSSNHIYIRVCLSVKHWSAPTMSHWSKQGIHVVLSLCARALASRPYIRWFADIDVQPSHTTKPNWMY